MKIAFLNPTEVLGGAERSLLDILAGLRAAKPDWSLTLIAADEGPLSAEARALGVDTRVLPFPPRLAALGDSGAAGGLSGRLALALRLCGASLGAAAYTGRLRRLLADISPDVVHTNGFKMHILGKWAKPLGKPLLWHVHDYVGSRAIMAGLMRRHLGKGMLVVTNSISVANDFTAVCGEQARVSPVYYGMDLDRFSPSGPSLDLDALSGLPQAGTGIVRVGLVAALARWKGQEVFLKALSLLPEPLPVRGYIVGDTLYQTKMSQYSLEELRAVAARLGLTGRVGFTRFIGEPAEAMRALDVVVHASTRPEPFGRVIMEAMGCGRPVIVSPAGGAAEIITEGVDALTHPPGDAAALARRIEELARDAGLRARLGQAGRAAALKRFSRARMAADLIPAYEELAARGCS